MKNSCRVNPSFASAFLDNLDDPDVKISIRVNVKKKGFFVPEYTFESVTDSQEDASELRSSVKNIFNVSYKRGNEK